jgi:hypothetical protein
MNITNHHEVQLQWNYVCCVAQKPNYKKTELHSYRLHWHWQHNRKTSQHSEFSLVTHSHFSLLGGFRDADWSNAHNIRLASSISFEVNVTFIDQEQHILQL